MDAALAGVAEPEMCLGELALPAGPPEPAASPPSWTVAGRAPVRGQEQHRLPVGTARQRPLARQPLELDRLGGLVGPAPMVGKQRVEAGQLTRVVLFVPLGDRLVQRSALGPHHQLIGHVAGDHVLEDPRQLRVRRLGQDQAALLQALQLASQRRAVSGDGIDVVQQAVGEAAPDDAGHLEGQLLRRRQAVDAGQDDTLHRVRQRQILQVGVWRDPAAPVADGDDPGVPEGVGEFLAEERVAAGVLADELGHRLGHRGDPQPLPDERGDVISRQGIEVKLLGIGRLAEPLVLLRGWVP